MVYIKSTRVFKVGDKFYKDGTIFKGHIRGTIAEARREYTSIRAYKYKVCPKSVRRTFKEDYMAFKERWGKQDIYVKISGAYDNDTNMGQFQVVLPVYKVEGGKIKKIYNEVRGRYPLGILEVVECNGLPREGGVEIEPGEKYIDCIDKYGRDADMFVALSGHKADIRTSTDDENEKDCEANITGAGKPIINIYNYGYNYINGQLQEVREQDLTTE